MTHNKLLHLGLMLISVLAIGPGCVNVENEPAHRTWPKAIKVQTVNQFQGIYRDASLDPATGQVGKYGTGLFAALSGQRHSQGDQCELRFSPDGNVLHLKLKDSKGKQIEAADLKRSCIWKRKFA